MRIESRRLEDGRGGLFFNDELIDTFDTEEESDAAGIKFAQAIIVLGVGKQDGVALKDEKPYDLFGEYK